MEKLKINISCSKDSFGAYAENVEGLYAAGDTLQECKEDVQTAIALLVENREQNGYNLPQWLINGDYEIEYSYDAASLLKRYGSLLNMTTFAKQAGVNPRQMQRYASGAAVPRREQRRKISAAINRIGREMVAVTL